MITTVVRPGPEAALCGFDRCRAPLPGPGPRGGRPYEFCPDRVWPGGKTCKQLAAAQDALRDALGQPTDMPALLGVASAVSMTLGQALPPVRELLDALTAMKAATDGELIAAARRVEQAEVAAAEERGLREAAEQRAEQAAAITAEATSAAELAAAERVRADEDRETHRKARRQAEQALQHAEGRVTAIQAELARTIQRADTATTRAADLDSKLAATAAELSASDATRRAGQARAETAERRVADLAAQLDTLHTRVEAMQARHDQAMADARADTDRVREQLEQRLRAARADQDATITGLRDNVNTLNRELGAAQHAQAQAEARATAATERAAELVGAVRDRLRDHEGGLPDELRRLLGMPAQQPSP